MSVASSRLAINHPSTRKRVIPNTVLGTMMFALTEIMFFMGLISAYLVIRAASGGAWVPPGELRLPVLVTGFNTMILLLSGLQLFVASRRFANFSRRNETAPWLLRAILLGAFFVAFQGYEWVQLVRFGMTLQTSTFASCFYLLIGSHAAHALAAILVMTWLYRKLLAGHLRQDHLISMEIFWYLVVGIWPVLYGLVYF